MEYFLRTKREHGNERKTMPRFHYIDPYTSAWWKARRGIPTASQFHRIITLSGKPSEQSRRYMYELIAERLLDETMKTDMIQTYWMERGHQMEPKAIEAFQETHRLVLKRVGFVTTNDGRIGCSPDCLVEGSVQAVEIKCPAPWNQIGLLLDGPDDKYKPQVQGQLLVGGWETVHLFAYHPQMPSFHLETHPDRAYQAAMAELLDRFCRLLDHETERARAKGAYYILDQLAETG
jgi:hypothetical protein